MPLTYKQDEKRKLINSFRMDIYQKKDISNTVKSLEQMAINEDINLKKLLALAYFEKGEYQKAARLYKDLDLHYESGFSELLSGDKKQADFYWTKAKETPAIQWGRALIGFINLRLDRIPTFFQIRNFLENDLGYLLKAKQLEFAENLISCEDIMIDINIETYKFIGRALMNNGYPELCLDFYKKSRNLISNDPEVYYLIAQYYFENKNYLSAIDNAKLCLSFNTGYFPASTIIEKSKQAMNLRYTDTKSL